MKFCIDVLYQLVSIFGIVLVVGLVLYLCQNLVFKMCGPKSYKVVKYMGIIGTPIHELGHAFFCVLFGHKIDEIKLFTPKSEDSLGHVTHRYNKKNPIHQIGNYFIGIGPIIFGTTILSLLMFFLIPDLFNGYFHNFTKLVSFDLGNMFETSLDGIKNLFSGNYKNPYWYLFILISFFIVLHMILSPSDIKSSLKGIIFIIILLLAIDGILYLINPDFLGYFTYYICVFGQLLFYFLLLSTVLSVFLVILTFFVIKLPRMIISMIRKK